MKFITYLKAASYFLNNRKDVVREQKEQITYYIDQLILKKEKQGKKNVAMAWIDLKKSYWMILQTWIIKCQKIFVSNFMTIAIENWGVE